MKNKRLVPVLVLCGLSSACCSPPPSSGTDYLDMSPECRSYYHVHRAHLDQLEATGRFPPDRMACFRRFAGRFVAGYYNSKSLHTEEYINEKCLGFARFIRKQMQKAEEIPGLSQEEFDARWGTMMSCHLAK